MSAEGGSARFGQPNPARHQAGRPSGPGEQRWGPSSELRGPGKSARPASQDGPALTRATAKPRRMWREVEPSPPRRAGRGLRQHLGKARATRPFLDNSAEDRGDLGSDTRLRGPARSSMSAGHSEPPRAPAPPEMWLTCGGRTRKATHGAFTAPVTAPRAGDSQGPPPSKPPELGTARPPRPVKAPRAGDSQAPHISRQSRGSPGPFVWR